MRGGGGQQAGEVSGINAVGKPSGVHRLPAPKILTCMETQTMKRIKDRILCGNISPKIMTANTHMEEEPGTLD